MPALGYHIRYLGWDMFGELMGVIPWHLYGVLSASCVVVDDSDLV